MPANRAMRHVDADDHPEEGQHDRQHVAAGEFAWLGSRRHLRSLRCLEGRGIAVGLVARLVLDDEAEGLATAPRRIRAAAGRRSSASSGGPARPAPRRIGPRADRWPTTLISAPGKPLQRDDDRPRLGDHVEQLHGVAVADRAVRQHHELRIAVVQHVDLEPVARQQRIDQQQIRPATRRRDRRRCAAGRSCCRWKLATLSAKAARRRPRTRRRIDRAGAACGRQRHVGVVVR